LSEIVSTAAISGGRRRGCSEKRDQNCRERKLCERNAKREGFEERRRSEIKKKKKN